MIIFTGTGRSGTGWLAQCFYANHEYRAREFVKQMWPNMAYDWSSPDRRIGAMRWLLSGVDQKTFKDSCNLYVHFLDAVHIVFPAARIVVCERNKDDYVKSAVMRGWHKYHGYHCEPGKSDPAYAAWGGMTPEERCGWQWTFRLAKARERLQTVPEHLVLWCKLEDISQDLSPVEQFLGIEADNTWRNRRYLRGRAIHAHQ